MVLNLFIEGEEPEIIEEESEETAPQATGETTQPQGIDPVAIPKYYAGIGGGILKDGDLYFDEKLQKWKDIPKKWIDKKMDGFNGIKFAGYYPIYIDPIAKENIEATTPLARVGCISVSVMHLWVFWRMTLSLIRPTRLFLVSLQLQS